MRFFLAVCLLSLLQLSILPDAAGPKLQSTTPNSSLVLKGAIEAARDLPRLHSLLVSRQRLACTRAVLQRRERQAPGQRQVRVEERHFGARRHRRGPRPDSGSRHIDRSVLRRYSAYATCGQACDHDRGPAHHALGPPVDEQQQLRGMGAELQLGAVTCSHGRSLTSPAR